VRNNKLPPNFKSFFYKELKKWTSMGNSKMPLGTSVGDEIRSMVDRAKEHIQKDIDEHNKANEIMNPKVADGETKIIKESGSEKPIK